MLSAGAYLLPFTSKMEYSSAVKSSFNPAAGRRLSWEPGSNCLLQISERSGGFGKCSEKNIRETQANKAE